MVKWSIIGKALLSSHLALSADFTKMSLSSPVHIHGHVVVLTAVKTYSVNYFLILMTFLSWIMRPSLINLMVRLSLKVGGEV